MDERLSPAQVARALGVSESTAKRWCDRGVLETLRTEGGHRRVSRRAVLDFARTRGQAIADPALLGLPAELSQMPPTEPAALLLQLLLDGDSHAVRQLLMQLYLSGHSISAICDGLLATSLRSIGEKWQRGEAHVFQERRAVMIVARALRDIHAAIPEPDGSNPDSQAPLAAGASLSGDVYDIPTLMAELVLRAAGWRAVSLGSNIPGESLAEAVVQLAPRLFWLSVSHVADPERLVCDCEAIYQATSRVGAVMVLGGRALDDDLRRHLRYSAHLDTMSHLVDFAHGLTETALQGSTSPST